jgi:uncharacterized protein YceK
MVMARVATLVFLAILAAAAVPGCGTVNNLVDPPMSLFLSGVPSHSVYGGVQYDLALLRTDNYLIGYALTVLDIPLSAAADTAALPLTLYLDRQQQWEQERRKEIELDAKAKVAAEAAAQVESAHCESPVRIAAPQNGQ